MPPQTETLSERIDRALRLYRALTALSGLSRLDQRMYGPLYDEVQRDLCAAVNEVTNPDAMLALLTAFANLKS